MHTLQNEMSPRAVSFILLVIHLHVFSITISSVPFLDFQIAIKSDNMVCEEKRGHLISEHKIAKRSSEGSHKQSTFSVFSVYLPSHNLIVCDGSHRDKCHAPFVLTDVMCVNCSGQVNAYASDSRSHTLTHVHHLEVLGRR